MAPAKFTTGRIMADWNANRCVGTGKRIAVHRKPGNVAPLLTLCFATCLPLDNPLRPTINQATAITDI